MAPSAVSSTPMANSKTQMIPSVKRSTVHPLSPLNANEIINASHLLQQSWFRGTDLHFKSVTLQEPPKALVVPVLEAENKGQGWTPLDRKAFISYYIRRTVCFT